MSSDYYLPNSSISLKALRGRYFNLRFYKLKKLGLGERVFLIREHPWAAAWEPNAETSISKASAFPLTVKPTSFILKWFTLFISTAKHSSKKSTHHWKFIPPNQKYPTKGPVFSFFLYLFYLFIYFFVFSWSIYFLKKTVTVDISILFFICLVSPGPAWSLSTRHQDLTCRPALTEWN